MRPSAKSFSGPGYKHLPPRALSGNVLSNPSGSALTITEYRFVRTGLCIYPDKALDGMGSKHYTAVCMITK